MELSDWAIIEATPSDFERARKAFNEENIKITFKDPESLKPWMKSKGWKIPWLFTRQSFTKQLFDNNENYQLAVREHIVKLMIPKMQVTITKKQLDDFDESYESRSWSYVVESLREIRRAVEAGVIIEVDGKTLKSWNQFYSWAHSRYHLLEESSDKWIGDDR